MGAAALQLGQQQRDNKAPCLRLHDTGDYKRMAMNDNDRIIDGILRTPASPLPTKHVLH